MSCTLTSRLVQAAGCQWSPKLHRVAARVCAAWPQDPRVGRRHLTGGERRPQTAVPPSGTDLSRQTDLAAKVRPYFAQLDYFGTMKHFLCAPKSYLILGTAGLVPFAAPTLYIVASGVFHSDLIHLQVVYGAAILAFLGGVRWGHLLGTEGIKASTYDVGMSTLPSLAAVASLLLPHPGMDVAVLCSLLAAGFYDGLWQAYPVWFRALRLGLTTVAALSIVIALFGRMILPKPKE